MKIEQCLVINLPAEKIFDYIADVENWVECSSVVIAVKKTAPGIISAGATWRCTTRFLGRWLETTYELVEHEPSHFFTLKSISGLCPTIFSCKLETVECGRTNVSVEAVISHIEGFLGLEDSVVVSAVRRQMDGDLQTLRDILEARTTITNSNTFGK
jgi:Polyketide cyclase / dehydrase and lipid transport